MTKANHKYRVSVYLGKEIYTRLEEQSKVFGISIATLTKLLIETGFTFADTMEKKGGLNNGIK